VSLSHSSKFSISVLKKPRDCCLLHCVPIGSSLDSKVLPKVCNICLLITARDFVTHGGVLVELVVPLAGSAPGEV
jgi:hypothetical protein